MPVKETEDQKLYWSVSDVAKELNVNESQIRFWDREFDMIKPLRTKNGVRMFTREDVDNLRHVYHLMKEKGHTIEGARKMLKYRKAEFDANLDVRNTLTGLRSFLVELKESI